MFIINHQDLIDKIINTNTKVNQGIVILINDKLRDIAKDLTVQFEGIKRKIS